MAKNLKGKTRKTEDPYEKFTGTDQNGGKWDYRVLKHYQSPENEAKNPYARVLVAASTPMTYDTFEMGDIYVSDLMSLFGKVNVAAQFGWYK